MFFNRCAVILFICLESSKTSCQTSLHWWKKILRCLAALPSRIWQSKQICTAFEWILILLPSEVLCMFLKEAFLCIKFFSACYISLVFLRCLICSPVYNGRRILNIRAYFWFILAQKFSAPGVPLYQRANCLLVKTNWGNTRTLMISRTV